LKGVSSGGGLGGNFPGHKKRENVQRAAICPGEKKN